MTILLIMFLIIFVAQSYTEFKLVNNIPWFKRNFYGWRASVISGGISIVMGTIAGTTIGAQYTLPFIMAGILGAATNELTFNFFTWYFKTKTRVQATKVRWAEFKEERPQFVKDVGIGVQGVGKLFLGIFAVIGKIIRGIGWISERATHIRRHKVDTV